MPECPECGSNDLSSRGWDGDTNHVTCENCGNDFDAAPDEGEGETLEEAEE